MSEEKRTNCRKCGAARAASCHVRGSGAFTHDYERTPRPQKRPTRIAVRSERGVDEFEEWQERKAEHLAAFPECELAGFLPGKCWSPDGAPDVHHLTPRGMGGSRYDEDTELVTACRAHHDYVERHREFAKVHGLLRSRQLPPHLRTLGYALDA